MDESEVKIEFDDGQTILVKGIQGDRGEKGDPGYSPIKYVDYRDGYDGENGKDGKSIKGEPGEDGKDGSPDTPKDIANKLNTLKDTIEPSVIKGYQNLLTPFEERLGSLEKSNTLKPKGPIDQRFHGAGLSKVSTDSTLTGLGTPASPLSVASSGGVGAWTSFTVDGTTVTFSVTKQPIDVNSDGIILFNSNGYSYNSVAKTITFINPPQQFAGWR